MIPKNKLLPSSTIQYLPKTKLGSLLITSKLPMVYERRILVLLLKSYIQYILCIYVYMYSRIHEYTFSLFQQNNGCKAVCLICRIFVDSA